MVVLRFDYHVQTLKLTSNGSVYNLAVVVVWSVVYGIALMLQYRFDGSFVIALETDNLIVLLPFDRRELFVQ
jgi:hypothetical protein